MKFLILAVWLAGAGKAAAFAPGDIDSYFQSRWSEKKLTPSTPAADGLFLRRTWLDLAGTVPPASEVVAFEADRAPGKRADAVGKLLASPLFGESWSDRWRALLLQGTELARNRALSRPFDRWLARELNAGTPFDRIARRMVAGEGPAHENPEVAYVAQFRDSPEALTGHTAKVLLGVQIQCAQCHDHPFEKWKQRDFYGLHAFFARVQTVPVPRAGFEAIRAGRVQEALEMAEAAGKDPKGLRRRAPQLQKMLGSLPAPSVGPEESASLMGRGPLGGRTFVVLDRPRGEAVLPDPAAPQTQRRPTGQVIGPRFLDGTAPPWPDPFTKRRELLAAWMTAPQNPYFARAVVNRVWWWLFGRGLVEPVDNIAAPDEKTHARLLDELAAHFAASNYDLKGLLRLLTDTRIYALSMRPPAGNARDAGEFARALPRPMEPEQLFASLMQATGARDALRARDDRNFEEQRERWLTRFVRLFENDAGAQPEPFHGTLQQALFLLNAPALQKAVAPMPGGAARAAFEACVSPRDPWAGIELLYLAAYARRPGEAESKTACDFLLERGARPQAWGDLLWALVTSAEFLVNH